MKVAELRQKIQDYDSDKLKRVILEMYKVVPKSLKEARGIDSIILNPDTRPAKPREPATRDLAEIRSETEEFLLHAYSQYYFAPNSVVPKKKRPQWRFTVRRLFKELVHAAENPNNVLASGHLLKSLYEMLCYSCRYVLFSAYDPFESVGIRQVDFFRVVLDIEKKVEQSRGFVRSSVLMALSNGLNRYTLREELFEIVIACLETADLKEIAIEVCDDLRKDATAGRLRDIEPFSKDGESYRAKEFVKNLAVLGWMCHMALDQPDHAVGYFRQHYAERDPEIALYVLLRLIGHCQSWALWLRIYEEALGSGVRPREELQRRYKEIRVASHHEH